MGTMDALSLIDLICEGFDFVWPITEVKVGIHKYYLAIYSS